LVFLAALEYLVLPQIAGTRTALRLLGDVQPGWLTVGFILEALSLVSYSLLTRSVLPNARPPFLWLLRTDLTALGLSHIVPGGTVTASPLRYRLLKDGGTSSEDAVVGATVEGIGSAFVLLVIFWLALILSIPFTGVDVLYICLATVVASTIALTAVGAAKRSPGSGSNGRTASIFARLPARLRGRVAAALDAAWTQLTQLLADRKALRNSALWATGSWLLDAASLWVFLAAYGSRPNPIGLLVGYGLANLVAILPISPGGLGVIEGILIPSLIGFGAAPGAAVLGVVSWRLFNFWAPIPTAAVCYLTLRTQDWQDRHDGQRPGAVIRSLFSRAGAAGLNR
jgi:uncharacterized protein (TIRG00374 family)